MAVTTRPAPSADAGGTGRGTEHQADRLPLENPYFAHGPRHVGYVLAASVVMLPLLVPSGPGNTALADVGILALVVVVSCGCGTSRSASRCRTCCPWACS